MACEAAQHVGRLNRNLCRWSPWTSDVNSRRTFRAEDLTIVDQFRFERVSDPDDSSIVVAMEGDHGTRGLSMGQGDAGDPKHLALHQKTEPSAE